MATPFDFRLLLERFRNLSMNLGDFSTIQKYSWVMHLFIIFLLAKSISNIMVNYIDHKIQPSTHVAAPTLRPSTPPKAMYPSREEFNIITRRNIFNPNAKEEEVTLSPKKGMSMSEAGAVPTSLPLELVGTIILSDAARSIGAIKDKSKNQTESYQAGDLILNKAKVFKVEPYKVYFQNTETGSMEYVEIKEEKQIAEGPGAGSFADVGGGIRQSGEGRFVIDRGALESSLSNPNEILTQARAVPNIVDGKIKGFKIFSIKPGSIYEKLGIQNGDTIERVNGTELDSPSKALEFYGAITSASEVALDIDRAGQKKSFQYQIKN